MMLTLLVTSKGIAAVPRASLVVLSGTLTAFGLPLEGVAVILGVDELMDMARTMVNLVGNCLATAVMGRWEGELDPDQPAAGRGPRIGPLEPAVAANAERSRVGLCDSVTKARRTRRTCIFVSFVPSW